jgi:glycosyltransferase involved in cell wall biosynthesis
MMNEKEVARRTTAIVASYERPAELDRLVSSFRGKYPNLPIVVADNSVNKYPRSDVEYLAVEDGSGISKSRNKALEAVRTDFTLLVDDDNVCLRDTRIEEMIDFLLKNELDIVAGRTIEAQGEQFDFHGCYHFQDGKLYHYVAVARAQYEGWDQFDVTPNFFVARSSAVKELRWDPNLRFAKEHDDFFLRAQRAHLKVSYLPDVALLNDAVVHHHGGTRGAACEEYFFNTWNVTDKIEVRWIQSPFSRLSFYSTRYRALIEPCATEFHRAVSAYRRIFPDFSVLNPYSDTQGDGSDE